MYLKVFLILCVGTLVYRLAQADGRSGLVWGPVGLLTAVLCFRAVSQPLLAALASILICIILMTLANIWLPASKGAGLKKGKR